MRVELGILEEALVNLRFGGLDTFDLGWAQETVVTLLIQNRDWRFMGLNTERLTDQPHTRLVPMVLDPTEKASIIAASDVFLAARGHGEDFGVSIAEALQIGIPLLAWNEGTGCNHIHMLSGLGALFRQPRDLRQRLRRIARWKDPSTMQGATTLRECIPASGHCSKIRLTTGCYALN